MTLPRNWTISSIGQLTDKGQYGWTTKAAIKGDVKFLRTTDITKGRINWSSVPFCAEPPADLEKYLLESDDIVISRAGSVGFSRLLEEIPNQTVFASYLIRFKPSKAVVPRYLAAYLNSDAYWKGIGAASVGIALANVNAKNLAALPVPLPPIAEQKRIADKLDSILTRVDAVKTSLASVSPTLKRFRQSVLAAATSGRLTEDWRATATATAQSAAGELVQYIAQRAKKEKKPPAQPDMAHWKRSVPANWTIASVQQFAECLDRLRVPIKRDQRQSEMGLYPYYGANGEVGRIDQFIFDDELVLVTEDETFYGREKPIAYRSSGKCWVNNHAHVLRAPSKAANDYLCFSLMYYDVVPWLSGTTGRAKLTQQALNSLPIAVPPALEISEIVRRVETLFAFADRLEARLQVAQAAATRLTPSLLAKAFRGELVTQDPEDEPASELLKRLVASAPTTVTHKKQSKTTS
jgi:type I restriction enzyme S subunit